MSESEERKKRQQELEELLQGPAPEPRTRQEEVVEILAEGLFELIIQRGREEWIAKDRGRRRRAQKKNNR